MSDLRETLSLVHSMAPALAGHLAPVLQHGDRLQQSAQAFLHDLQQKHSEATAHLNQLHAAFSELRAAAAGRHQHLDQETQAIEAALQDCLHALEADEGQLVHQAEAVDASARELEQHLHDDGSQVEAGEGESHQALAALDGAVQSGQAELDQALHAAADQARGLAQAVDQARGSMTAAVGTLRESLHQHLTQAQNRVAQAVQTLHGLAEAQDGHVRAAADDLSHKKDHLREELEREAHNDLQQRLEAQAGHVCEALSHLQQAVDETRAASEHHREEIQARFEELAQAMPPLETAVESVKRAAEEVGVRWG